MTLVMKRMLLIFSLPLFSSLTGFAFTLQILHASDFEASVSALDDAPRFSSVVEALKDDYPTNTIVLSSGDNYIPGPFYTASADPAAPYKGVKGRGDILILNALGIQASAFGNHDFDDGTAQVRSLINAEAATNYPGTRFPYLSANLDCTTDGSLSNLVVAGGQEWNAISNRISASAAITVNGERVGLVGATTPDLKNLSNAGGVTVWPSLVNSIQSAVNQLTTQGVDKIILMTHLQVITNEYALAGQLTNVDVIIAGGSHLLFAKSADRLRAGDTRYADYPVALTDAAGRTVYVINTAANYRYVGRLIADFDDDGLITSVHANSGAYATDDQGVTDTGGRAPDSRVTNVTGTLAAIIDGKDSNCFGRTTVYLNGLRDEIRSQETNLGDLAMDAHLAYARAFDTNVCIAIDNAGGIRDSIGAIRSEPGVYERIPPPANPRVGKQTGQISQLDIENSLRFNNGLVIMTLTAQQLRDAIESGVAGDYGAGRFPTVGGLWFSWNPTNEPLGYYKNESQQITGISNAGTRVRSLVVQKADDSLDLVVEHGEMVGDTNRAFRILAVSFIADGGEDYYPLTLGTDRTNLTGGVSDNSFGIAGREQYSLTQFLAMIGTFNGADVGVELDERNQILSYRADGVLCPYLTELVPTATVGVVGAATLGGKEYIVQTSGAIKGEWTDVAGGSITGDGRVASTALTNSIGTAFFYRIKRTN